tara:strand:+ start:32377 stop:33246 length:870 start_codon:yes stop_codon:yes gene_type:complete
VNFENIILGTAQFGMDYGVVNHDGQPSVEQAQKTLKYFFENGGQWLDTAPAYGTSEELLGHLLKGMPQTKIISKTSVDPELGYSQSVESSLQKLKVDKLGCLLVHRPDALLGNKELQKELIGLKEKGLVSKVGISVYDPQLAIDLLRQFQFDVLQTPCNVFDQRVLATEVSDNLVEHSVEVHCRSIYLQGLLLTECQKIPKKFAKYSSLFKDYSDNLEKLRISHMQAALGFISSHDDLHKYVIGVDSEEQLKELARCEIPRDLSPKFFDQFAQPSKEILIDPSRWHEIK